jgi:hypothetical protein
VVPDPGLASIDKFKKGDTPVIFRSEAQKAKVMWRVGTFAISFALLLRVFVHPSTAPGTNWLHGISGFLVGISIVFNLGSVMIRNRLRNCAKA